MEELEDLRQRMLSQRPDGWEDLPDISLYMDQLISYMPRQLIRFEGGDNLTSAMVNNYIKDGIMPRAEGKRYGREHLAYLTAISALKPVMSMKEMNAIFSSAEEVSRFHGHDPSVERWYEVFLQALDKSLTQVGGALPTDLPREELCVLALELALQSYAAKLACQRVLGILKGEEPSPEEEKKAEKEAKRAEKEARKQEKEMKKRESEKK